MTIQPRMAGLLVFAATTTWIGCAAPEGAETMGGETMEMPAFPWPPPRASVAEKLPGEWLQPAATFGDVADTLAKALKSAGHRTVDYYGIPDGFALVSELEQIDKDGISLEPPDRWSVAIPPLRKFSLRAYLSRLFTGARGHYRVVAFLVTPAPMPTPDSRPSLEEVKGWVGHGALELPEVVYTRPWSRDVACWAFIYEFVKVSEEDNATVANPSRWGTRDHLTKGNILEHIRR